MFYLKQSPVSGTQVDRINKSTVKINGSTIGDVSVDYEYIKKIRGFLLSSGSTSW